MVSWNQLKKEPSKLKMKHNKKQRKEKRKKRSEEEKGQEEKKQKTAASSSKASSQLVDKAQYLGLDCEMVGIGRSGAKSVLARCCMVDYDGRIVYDKFVRPNDRVTDFRTHVSGIKPHLIKEGITLRQVRVMYITQ